MTFFKDKIAMLTGTAIQDDETFKSEGGFIPERDQYYFQMQQGENVFLVGSKELLICLRLLEKMGEFPEIGRKMVATDGRHFTGGEHIIILMQLFIIFHGI